MKKELQRVSLIIFYLLVMGFNPSLCFSKDPSELLIPNGLADWKEWVLHGKENELCPSPFDNGADFRCQWPSRLRLSLDPKGGQFEQSWLMFSEGWVRLPGGSGSWPQSVMVENIPAPVMMRKQSPSLRLGPGEHRVTGKFDWVKLPEMILLPSEVGLVDLVINGQPIEFPEIDDQGRLWLAPRKEDSLQEDLLSVRIFRLLNDSIPMQVTTHIQINVSGRPREVRLENILPDQSIPILLDTALPAKLTPGGALICQVRPGKWYLSVITRLPGPVTQLFCRGPYGNEIWSFQAQNHLRMVEISGAPSVEPERTDIPDEWRHLPAYSLSPGTVLTLKEIRRGDPDPSPDRLKLHRSWWLDFDGGGYTVQDNITGTMSRQWYLSMNHPWELGRVAVDGKDQLITHQGKENLPGVALRRGNLQLVADSRLNSGKRLIPAVGWHHDFEYVSGILHLPPGWRLLSTSGVDTISGTWIQRWTLLDFFLALIISLSVMKLRNWKWGFTALITMVLIFHEPGAPRLVWLHIIAASTLTALLPDGWVKKTVKIWAAAAAITLLVISIPFMVQQIRWGLYPQLAPIGETARSRQTQTSVVPSEMAYYETKSDSQDMGSGVPEYRKKKESSAVADSDAARTQHRTAFETDPNELIQTGPGLPDWQWQSFDIAWNGPVDKNQALRFWLVSPGVNLVLGVLRVLFLAVMISGLLEMRTWWQTVRKSLKYPGAVIALALFLLTTEMLQNAHAEYPPAELLQTLQNRLLEKPDCLPDCAGITRMAMVVTPETLKIVMEIHAATLTAIPLPATRATWTPSMVIMDQTPLSGLSRDKSGMMWALIPKGVHTVVMIGNVPGDVLNIPLPIKPHAASVDSQGWNVRGIHADGSVDSGIQMTRIEPLASAGPKFGNQSLSDFFHIRRVFHLGLTWQVSTTVKRISPAAAPVTIFFPLLANESVTTPGINVEQKTAQIIIPAQNDTFRFESSLAQSQAIVLKAPAEVPWTESWILDAGPIWQHHFSGIPVVHHQDQTGRWQPEWFPWPGESVKIDISRPKAIPGQITTINAAKLEWTPGLRFNKARLNLSILTSQGGQHEITLPDMAELQEIQINGKSLPIRQEGVKLTLPLQPGAQEVLVEWHQQGTSNFLIKGPRVFIGGDAVNADLTFHMPQNRWTILTGGPRLGPAVLFWSYLIVVILAALALKKIDLAPLKTYQWLLLGFGLTQVPPVTALVVVGWLLALGLRREKAPPDKWLPFNTVQFLLVIWTLAALTGLYGAVERGLLGIPDMQIAGNQSTSHLFHWTQDRIFSTMPQPWAISLPLWVYRLLMLLWSLWLAFSLLKWLQWGWRCFSSGKLWKKLPPRKKPRKAQNHSKPSANETVEAQQEPPPL